MTDYYCPKTELAVYKGGETIHPTEIKGLKVRDLLEHKLQAFGDSVNVEEIDEERVRFVFRGLDHNKTYSNDEPAENLLKGIIRLGTYYDHTTDQFVF